MPKAHKLLLREAHIAERPLAQLTAITFNVNRGKKTKPIKPEDLYHYATADDINLPKGRFGASMLRAVEEKMFPRWGLFAYKPLSQSASGVAPEEYIAVASDLCVLAPRSDGTHLTGMVLARESAGGKVRQLVSNDGTIYTVETPKIPTKFVADDSLKLTILAVVSPEAPD